MKQKIVLALLAVVVASTGAMSASVGATPPQSDVTGVITENHTAVAGATVTVLCNGHTEVDTTDAFGSYLVTFLAADCPFGATVKVTATKDNKSGVASGTIQGITTKLNLAIVNVSIPEYGLIGGILAGGAGVGMIAFARRRQQQNLQV
jgi:hypothetical protein